MFDDIKQEGTESHDNDLFSSQDVPLMRRIGFGAITLLLLVLAAWYIFGSSNQSQNTPMPSDVNARLTALEKVVFSSKPVNGSIAVADTGSGAVGPFNNPILDDPRFPPESDDMVLPIEEQIEYPGNKSSDVKETPPKEIALEFSNLFEQEIASTQPSSQPSTTPTSSATAQPSQPQSAGVKSYTVQKGDTLSKISLQFYGTSKKWQKIVDANRSKLGNNQVLRSGMQLVIPPDTSKS